VDTLKKAHSQTVGQIEALTRQKRALEDRAQAADGLGAEEATRERRAAEAGLAAAQRAKGVADAQLRTAAAALAAAERGDDVAAEQIRALRAAGIDATALVDAVTLDEDERAIWEARLLPYRNAVVVRHADGAAAAEVLAKMPGSLVVCAGSARQAGYASANPAPAGAGSARQAGYASANPAPAGAGSARQAGYASANPAPAGAGSAQPAGDGVRDFLAALADRAGTEPTHIDTAAGVLAIGGFAEPFTGRAGRVRQALAAREAAAEADGAADAAVATAERSLERAREREEAAQAGERAVELDETIAQLRAENEANEAEQDNLHPLLARAMEAYQQALTDKAARDTRVGFIRDTIKALERDQAAAVERWSDLTARREALDLAGRHTAWGGTVDAAHQHILLLDQHEQRLSAAEWDDAADDLAERTRRKCFPAGTPAEQLPEELRVLDEQRGSRRVHDRVRLVPALLRITDTYLAQHAKVDDQQLTEIEAQRAEKIRTLGSAETALVEARQASAALRGTLATAIKAKLKQVAAEFDRIDKAYGGYGGTLDYPEPEPPADPDKPWRWSVTPKWRRSEGKAPASYRLRGNTAQMDDKAVKLVCAAALAGTEDRPLLLVLDELGRNLGAAHRRDAVALFENIGRDRAISVVGALQDDMERYAIGASSLYIKLRRTSDTMPYNQAPVVIGNDANKARVELLAGWLTSYRSSGSIRG
jgi:tetratricopeptide (TPR) repeat protein